MRTRGNLLRRAAAALMVATGALLFLGAPTAAGQTGTLPFKIGDVFAGVGLAVREPAPEGQLPEPGLIKEYSPDGTIYQTLDTLSNSAEETGMCFDGNTPTSSLRSTNFTANDMSLIPQEGPVVHPWGSGFNTSPESCLVTIDPTSDPPGQTVVYVGQADGTKDVLKFDVMGKLITSYDVKTEDRGSDWIDLAADHCTLYYTSEGSSVLRFNLCTRTQLTDFATALPFFPCYALRIRANGDVLVACSDAVLRLSPLGGVQQVYLKPPEETSFLFALNLDPDNMSFWTAGYFTGNVYHYDITTGAIINMFTANIQNSLAGLAVFGEPVVSLAGTMEKSTPGKGTGGGYIDSLTGDLVGLATMLIQSGSPGVHLNSKATLGFVDQFKIGDAFPKGNLTYNDHDTNVTVKVTDWSLLAIQRSTMCSPLTGGLHATLRGMGTLNGMPGHSVRVEVDDCGEPGSGAMPDQFKIFVDEPAGYMAAGPLIGGNIQVRQS